MEQSERTAQDTTALKGFLHLWSLTLSPFCLTTANRPFVSHPMTLSAQNDSHLVCPKCAFTWPGVVHLLLRYPNHARADHTFAVFFFFFFNESCIGTNICLFACQWHLSPTSLIDNEQDFFFFFPSKPEYLHISTLRLSPPHPLLQIFASAPLH